VADLLAMLIVRGCIFEGEGDEVAKTLERRRSSP
jgi:hypothetical protein